MSFEYYFRKKPPMKRLYSHTLAWALYIILLYFFFRSFTDEITAIVHAASFTVNQTLIFYVNLFYLLPKYYKGQKYILYIIVNIVLTVSSSLFIGYLEKLTPEALSNRENLLMIKNLDNLALEPLFAHAMPSMISIFIALYLYSHTQIKKQKKLENIPPEEKEYELNETIHLKSDKKIYKIKISEIQYICSENEYLKYTTKSFGNLLVYGALKDIEKKLPKTHFLRIHRSHLINLREIKYVEGNRVRIHERSFPISETYRKLFFATWEKVT